MKIMPLADRILVKQDINKDSVSASGLVLSTKETKYNRGLVLAVGRDVEEVKKGDRIVFGEYAGSYIPDNEGNELLVLTESEVLATES